MEGIDSNTLQRFGLHTATCGRLQRRDDVLLNRSLEQRHHGGRGFIKRW